MLKKISAISARPRECRRRRRRRQNVVAAAALRTVFGECNRSRVIDTNFVGFRPAVVSCVRFGAWWFSVDKYATTAICVSDDLIVGLSPSWPPHARDLCATPSKLSPHRNGIHDVCTAVAGRRGAIMCAPPYRRRAKPSAKSAALAYRADSSAQINRNAYALLKRSISSGRVTECGPHTSVRTINCIHVKTCTSALCARDDHGADKRPHRRSAAAAPIAVLSSATLCSTHPSNTHTHTDLGFASNLCILKCNNPTPTCNAVVWRPFVRAHNCEPIHRRTWAAFNHINRA